MIKICTLHAAGFIDSFSTEWSRNGCSISRRYVPCWLMPVRRYSRPVHPWTRPCRPVSPGSAYDTLSGRYTLQLQYLMCENSDLANLYPGMYLYSIVWQRNRNRNACCNCCSIWRRPRPSGGVSLDTSDPPLHREVLHLPDDHYYMWEESLKGRLPFETHVLVQAPIQ